MQTQNHTSQHRDAMLKHLTALDFMLVDLTLFLNTHPQESEAVAEFNKIAAQADRLRNDYERAFGPLCSFRSKNPGTTWTWLEDPWPWSVDGNFHFVEGETFHTTHESLTERGTF